MNYRVIKDFVSKHGSEYKVGSIYSTQLLGSFSKSLIANNYIEPIKEAAPMMAITNVSELKPIAASKLAGVEIADRDYVEWGKKFFTFEEALKVEQELKFTGWRLPTRSEWTLICEEFGQENGKPDAETLVKRLGLARNGWYDFNDEEVYSTGFNGRYWSSTPYSNTNYAYYLYFNTGTTMGPSGNTDRRNGFSLRLVRDIEK